MSAFKPSATLLSRTYIGLIIAQFLAAFNDQAIHASSMFYAIHKETLTEAQAISLMPILFFAPWALFPTLAGYLSDRYSKRSSLVFWKMAEIGITLVALAGFCIGSGLRHTGQVGPWVVLSAVFLMGTHSAFFVPAKYGAIPEILQPQLLSKGNGILESTSFLAVILGTVCGGILSEAFRTHEYFIGLILVSLALVGAAASFLIEPMPAANPTRPFPIDPVTPLVRNLRAMSRSRPLALAALGIAFFTFMVAFMRATMYMHGESQIPRWSEFETSLVVASVALGVGFGSPLAGFLSGGKVELGLVPLGAVGMILATLLASFVLFQVPALIGCLILIGFFSGFYIVPLYTLLQHRAPKTSKGDFIATSNFINVTGAILASLLFFGLVWVAKAVGVARAVPQADVARGTLTKLIDYPKGHPLYIEVKDPAHPDQEPFRQRHYLRTGAFLWPFGARRGLEREFPEIKRVPRPNHPIVLEADDDVREGSEVIVSRWTESPRGVEHFEVRPADQPLQDAYDKEDVPRFLFAGASFMTLVMLLVLCRRLPDFFVRAVLWLRSHGRYRLKIVGLNHLPSNGPAILATNCDRFEACMNVVAATDRFTRFILFESEADPPPRPLLRFLARRTGLLALHPGALGPYDLDRALAKAAKTLGEGNLLGVTAEHGGPPVEVEKFLADLRSLWPGVAILPVYCGTAPPPAHHGVGLRRVWVVIGAPLPPDSSLEEIRQAIRLLPESVAHGHFAGEPPASAGTPAAAAAWPPTPAGSPPAPPSPG